MLRVVAVLFLALVSQAHAQSGPSTGVAGPGALKTLQTTLGGTIPMVVQGQLYDGPTVVQGTLGTWFAAGNVIVWDTAGSYDIGCVLWDGTTPIASGLATNLINGISTLTLAGFITNPAGNIRISCKDESSTSGVILFNTTNLGEDSQLSVFRLY